MPRILPGPMEGVMTGDVCRVMTEFDLVSMWITPFIRVTDSVPGRRRLAAYLEPFSQRPVIVQLMGARPDVIARAAERVASFPFVHGVELNCACPSKTVLRKGSGAALLERPDWIPETVQAIRRLTREVGVGVKVRAGVESPTELPRIMSCVAESQPDWCVLHYRTADEFYQPVENGWDRFHVARALVPNVPLFASGDLFSVDDCLRLGRSFPIDGMTPARGLMRNPWLLRQVEAELNGRVMDFHDITSFLIRLAELGHGDETWRVGQLLEVAGMAWGRDSDRFKALVGCPRAEDVLNVLRTI